LDVILESGYDDAYIKEIEVSSSFKCFRHVDEKPLSCLIAVLKSRKLVSGLEKMCSLSSNSFLEIISLKEPCLLK
jgi:hypothetical protein